MDQSFYIGSTAAQQQNMRMGIHGNNISNVNTSGFKAEKSRFKALMCQDVRTVERETQGVGVGSAMLASATDFHTGAVQDTGRTQDYMINGDGFFALADLETGEISYTRNGAFSVARLERPTGEVDENGIPVVDEGWYLTDGEGRLVLGTSGSVIEVEDAQAEQPVGVFDFINYDGMRHQQGTRFTAEEKNGGLRNGTGTVIRGKLESSNVDLAEELTKVIESQRAYGMALKLMQASDEIESTINGLRG